MSPAALSAAMAGPEAPLDPKQDAIRALPAPARGVLYQRTGHPARTAALKPGVSLAKAATRFVCQSCGAVTPKWAGRCETCLEWNTVEPETITPRPGAAAKAPSGQSVNFVGLRGDTAPP